MFFRPTRLPIDPPDTPDRGYATMRVTSPYGLRDGAFAAFHGGLDIGNARLGDDVIAIGPGTVIHASNLPKAPWNYAAPADKVAVWGPSYGGNVIVVEHEPGVWSQYVHLRDMLVAPGQRVTTGQLIGHIGDTGSAAPPPAGGGGHLHFGIRLATAVANGQNGFVDPWPRIQPTGDLPRLPDTAIEEDAMPKLIRAITGQKAAIRAGITVRRGRPSFGAPGFTIPASTVQPVAVVEGDAYRTASGTSSEWIEYIGNDPERRYFPAPYAVLSPINEAGLKLERIADAAKGARRAITAVINIAEE